MKDDTIRSVRQCDVFAGARYQGPMHGCRATNATDTKTTSGGTAPDPDVCRRSIAVSRCARTRVPSIIGSLARLCRRRRNRHDFQYADTIVPPMYQDPILADGS